jgi:hypothetical protein
MKAVLVTLRDTSLPSYPSRMFDATADFDVLDRKPDFKILVQLPVAKVPGFTNHSANTIGFFHLHD